MAGRIPKVVVVGPSYVDIAIKCHQVPQPGQIVDGGGLSCNPSGPGPNRAIEAAICDCESYLVSKVGEDVFGQMVRGNLEKNKVATDFVYIAQAMSTGVNVTMVDSIGENSGCVSAGANRALSKDEVGCAEVEQLIASADVCLIHGDLPVDVVKTTIRTAGIYKTKVLLEVDVPIRDSREIDRLGWPIEYFSANVLIPVFHNEGPVAGTEQGAGIVHKHKLIASEFVARGADSVILKMSARGFFIVERTGMRQIAAIEGQTVLNHTKGCDAFAGALAASVGAGDELTIAVKFAAAAAAIATGKNDTHEALASKQEIIQLLLNQPD